MTHWQQIASNGWQRYYKSFKDFLVCNVMNINLCTFSNCIFNNIKSETFNRLRK